MTERGILKYTLEQLKAKGIDHANCSLVKSTKYEMNVEAGNMSLLSTVFYNRLGLLVI